MATKAKLQRVMEPISGFVVDWDGYPQAFKQGDLFAEDHPLVLRYPDSFRVAHVRKATEEATAVPGEAR